MICQLSANTHQLLQLNKLLTRVCHMLESVRMALWVARIQNSLQKRPIHMLGNVCKGCATAACVQQGVLLMLRHQQLHQSWPALRTSLKAGAGSPKRTPCMPPSVLVHVGVLSLECALDRTRLTCCVL